MWGILGADVVACRRKGREALHGHRARAQLTLVEHALCPLDASRSLAAGLWHEASYAYTDGHRNRRSARVRIGALDGMSAHDELYLWGLLALALGQPEPAADFHATPYYCLRHLGLITSDKRGGREFELFRAAIKRLAGVRYQNDAFYDPVRGEHRRVSFGFLNYSLPLDAGSSRAWRFAWDPIFFEFAQATGGALSFDLGVYRELDPASRRLYLYLKKRFWRTETTEPLDLDHLTINVMGFAATLEPWRRKQRLARCLAAMAKRDLIAPIEPTGDTADMIVKRAKGKYTVRLRRGSAFQSPNKDAGQIESPLVEPLRAIGFDDRMIGHILKKYSARAVEQWADITLAARERLGDKFFTKSPQAYFLDNVKAAEQDNRTPPDWWREMRKQQHEQEREQERAKQSLLEPQGDDDFEAYLRSEAREAFEKVMQRLATDLKSSGQTEPQANRNARYMARMHFWNRYRQEHPHADAGGGFERLGSLA